MKILVACEYSGRVRNAFIAKGHDAISCDLLNTDLTGPHYTGDVRDLLDQTWDMIIAHPPCTYLCNSGIRWLYMYGSSYYPKDERRWENMREAAAFFRLFLDHPCKRIAIENPRPHKYAVDLIGEPTQYIQPWEHGEGQTKQTGLWLKGLPKIVPSNVVEGRGNKIHYASPGPNRSKERSETFLGIALAFAEQWG